jgi:formiminotetrahydrofolate cyclodeaminase
LHNVTYPARDTDLSNNNTSQIIYVNRYNPTATKPGSRGGGGLSAMLIGAMATGIFMIVFSFTNYKTAKKKQT